MKHTTTKVHQNVTTKVDNRQLAPVAANLTASANLASAVSKVSNKTVSLTTRKPAAVNKNDQKASESKIVTKLLHLRNASTSTTASPKSTEKNSTNDNVQTPNTSNISRTKKEKPKSDEQKVDEQKLNKSVTTKKVSGSVSAKFVNAKKNSGAVTSKEDAVLPSGSQQFAVVADHDLETAAGGKNIFFSKHDISESNVNYY